MIEIQALARGLEALRLVAKGARSPGEVAKALGVHSTSALRTLRTLETSGFVRRVGDDYFLGAALVELGYEMLGELDVRSVAADYLRSLNDLTGETILLTMRAGDLVFYADKVESKHPIRMYAQVGRPVELHCTGAGKAILAHSPDLFDALRTTGVLERFTGNTLASFEALAADLEETRRRGYALDSEEHEADINCIAAPLFGLGGVAVGAISIAAPAYRFGPEALLSVSGALLDATRAVGTILGAGSVGGRDR